MPAPVPVTPGGVSLHRTSPVRAFWFVAFFPIVAVIMGLLLGALGCGRPPIADRSELER